MWVWSLALAAPPTMDEVVARFAATGTPKRFMQVMDWVAADPARPPMLLTALAEGRVDGWISCEALERNPVPTMAPVLAPLTAVDDPLVRHACTRAYVAAVIKFRADPALLAARMESPDCEDRKVAADGLGAVDANWAAAFRDWLGRPPGAVDPCSQEVAAWGLGHAEPSLAGPVLTRLFVDARYPLETREAAGMSLASLRYPPSEGALVAMLAGPDPGGNLRMWAIRGLKEVGTPSALPSLDAVIGSDPYGGVGVWAVEGREARAAIVARAAR